MEYANFLSSFPPFVHSFFIKEGLLNPLSDSQLEFIEIKTN